MIRQLFSGGMSLVEDRSWKSYSLAEDQREDRTWGQAAGPSLQRRSWLWEYTRTSSDVSCPFRPLQIGYVGRNCFPGLSSSPGLEEGRHGKRIGTLPMGPKHFKQNSQSKSVVQLQNIICTARFPLCTGSLFGLWISNTKGQKYPFCSPQQSIPCPATHIHFYGAPVQRYLHELTWACNNEEVS